MKLLMLGSGSYKSSLSFRLVTLGKHLARDGWEVSIILPAADKYNNFTPEPRAQVSGIKLIQPWQLVTHSLLVNLFPYLMSSFFAILGHRAQVVYLYKPTPITILGLLPKLLFRTPVILDLDDLGSEVMKTQQQPALQVRLVAICEQLALRFSSAVVVTSTYLQKLVQDRYPNKPILLLPNGVDPADYTVRDAQTLRKHVYYFGALNRLSLIEDFLRALPKVIEAEPATRITIAGGGDALEAAKQLAAQLHIDHAIEFTGWIDMYDIHKYVQFGDIAICYQPDTPTVRAASNMKVFQYMAMGSVPVVSDVGDLALYTGHGQAGVVVPPANAQALALSLIELLKNPTERAAISKAARAQAETTYSWQRLSQALATFLDAQTKPAQRSVEAKEQA